MISIVIATRKRIKDLNKLLNSIHETCNDPQNFEILIRIDEDDTETIEFVENYNKNSVLFIKYIIGKRIGYINLPHMQRELCQIAKGDLLYYLIDDTIFVTKDWDEKMLETYNNVFDDNIYSIKTSHNEKCPEFLIPYFPVVTREWYEILGHYAPNISADYALYFINKLIRREIFLSDIIVIHDHTDPTTIAQGGDVDITATEGKSELIKTIEQNNVYSPQGRSDVVNAAVKISRNIELHRQKRFHIPINILSVYWKYLYKFKLFYYIYAPRVSRSIKYYRHTLGSSKFYPTDFKDQNSLLVKLYNAQDPISKYLHEKLSKQTLQLLNEFNYSKTISKTLQQALLNELNQALEDEKLYNEQRFAHIVIMKGETRKLIKQKTNKGSRLIRLNRLLLEETYPNEIVPSYTLKLNRK